MSLFFQLSIEKPNIYKLTQGPVEISKQKQEAEASPAEAAPAVARLKKMSLNRLRQMAWGMDKISMSEEAIASADKKTLIAAIMQAFRKVEE